MSEGTEATEKYVTAVDSYGRALVDGLAPCSDDGCEALDFYVGQSAYESNQHYLLFQFESEGNNDIHRQGLQIQLTVAPESTQEILPVIRGGSEMSESSMADILGYAAFNYDLGYWEVFSTADVSELEGARVVHHTYDSSTYDFTSVTDETIELSY